MVGSLALTGANPSLAIPYPNPSSPSRLIPPLSRFSFPWTLILSCLALAARQGTEPSPEPFPTVSPTATLSSTPTLVEKIDQGAAALGLDPVPTEPHLRGDHLSFMEAGIPAVLIHRFEDPRYHTESDRAEFVEPQLLEDAAKLTLLALGELAGP